MIVVFSFSPARRQQQFRPAFLEMKILQLTVVDPCSRRNLVGGGQSLFGSEDTTPLEPHGPPEGERRGRRSRQDATSTQSSLPNVAGSLK